jgi:ABC-2 type transport system ATP-binding protein
MREIISDLAHAGKTIFFSTHIVHDVEVICTNVGFIREGKLKGLGSIEDLLGKTIESMEIRFSFPTSKLNSKELLKLRFVPHAKKTMDGWVLEIENSAEKLEAEVNLALHEIIENKGVIRAVVPRKSSLEDIFFKESLGQFK